MQKMKSNPSKWKGLLWETIGITGGVCFILGILPIAFFVVSSGAVSQGPEVLSVAGILAVVGFIVLMRYRRVPEAPVKHSALMESLFKILSWVLLALVLAMGIYFGFTRV